MLFSRFPESLMALRRRPMLYDLLGVAAVGLSIFLLAAMIGAGLPDQVNLQAKPHRFPGGEKKAAAHAEDRRQAEIRQRFEQGVAMLQMGEFEHAVTAFHRVLSLNPTLPEAHLNIGFAFYELRNFSAAQKFFEGALALAPALNSARYGIGIAQLAQGDKAGARSSLLQFIDLAVAEDAFRDKARTRLREIDRAPSQPVPRLLPHTPSNNPVTRHP